MPQLTLIPGLSPNQYTTVATVSPGGSIPADNAPGLTTVAAQTQSANPGVGPPSQSAVQSLTTFQTPWLATSSLKASAPGVPPGLVTQAS